MGDGILETRHMQSMAGWTKEMALAEINRLIEDIEPLTHERVSSSEHTRWTLGAARLLSDVFGQDSNYANSLREIRWGNIGRYTLVGYEALNPDAAIKRIQQDLYLKQLDYAKGLLLAARDEISSASDVRSVYRGKNTGPEASEIIKSINLAEHKLRIVVRAIPTKEKEIQDSLESLLIGGEIEYSREAESFEYSSKSYIADFTLPRSDLAIEVKLCHREVREKEIIAEINDDILAYRTKYGNLLFVVYDCGFIRDIERFSGNFEMNDNVIVVVVKH